MTDPVETAGLVVGGGVGWKAVEFLFARFVSRADRERDDREKAVADKLDQVLSELHELKTGIAADRERAISQSAAVSEVKARIDGISANHGPRLGQLEQDMAATRERLDGLERRRGKK